jgi:hypothetical protein
LFQVHAVGWRLGVYDAAPDGQRFLTNGDAEPANRVPLTLVINWDAQLKKQQ